MERYYLGSMSGLVEESEGMEATSSTLSSANHATLEGLEEGLVSVA